VLVRARPADFDLVTVHVMSSCAMGADDRRFVVDLDGKVRGMKNVIVSDASILPSSFGESPQGTIMAFAHEVMDHHLNR
jgi:choline dehydrogenase-like flavoprotein